MANGNRNEVAIEIKAMLENAQPLYTTKCCIYRVPPQIRETNQAAYTPMVVSVGPLHHGDTKLLPMEAHKQLYCQKFIDRSHVSLDDLVSCVQEKESEVRQCYSDSIKLSKEELVKLILVDSGFLIELFLRFFYGRDLWERLHDAILLTAWLELNIRKDLLLLENQVPFFILEKLYDLAFETTLNGERYPSFIELTRKFFKVCLGGNLSSTCRITHFTDLLRASRLQPLDKQSPRSGGILNLLHNATELNEAGVKLRANDTSQSILDLQFSGGYLKIPPIEVDDHTEIILRNMLALEQCLYPEETYIADYMVVMDFLINTDKDVDVLVKHGIIFNYLGDNNELAELFNGLVKNIICGYSSIVSGCSNADYFEICNNLNAYCKHPLHSGMATLKRDYFNTPWTTVASIAGIVLLILTLIQTVFSILK